MSEMIEMIEMIERVARALCANNCLEETPADHPFVDANWRRYAGDAKAAIEAAAAYLESIDRDQAAATLRDPAPPRKRYQRI